MINTAYAGNAKMFDGILISALSTVKHTGEAMTVYLLTMDMTDVSPLYEPLSECHRAFLEEIYKSANENSRVILADMGEYYRQTLKNSPNGENEYTPYAFLRLYLPRIEHLDKVLYLDTDTVICNDISPLYNTDISDYEYAAALDYYGKVFMGYKYINSGVMLMNLDKIRKTGLFSKAIVLCGQKKLFLPDQTAIHRLTSSKLILENKFNEQKHYDRESTVIQHFAKTILWLPWFHTRNIKPWECERVGEILTHRFDPLFDEYKLKKEEFLKND